MGDPGKPEQAHAVWLNLWRALRASMSDLGTNQRVPDDMPC